jgi:pimeloyl-ACP methyl ester carboxylesterase
MESAEIRVSIGMGAEGAETEAPTQGGKRTAPSARTLVVRRADRLHPRVGGVTPRPLGTLGRGLLALPLLAVAALLFAGPPTPEGGTFGLALVAIALGLVVRIREATVVGSLLALALVLARLVFASDGDHLVVHDGRAIDRVLPERDVALGASRLLLLAGVIDEHTDVEHGLLESLRDGYDRMRDDEGWVPSPVLSTLALGHDADDFSTRSAGSAADFSTRSAGSAADFVTLERRASRTDAAVIFLHGSMGNVTLECWQVAQAAAAHGLPTFCPSTDTSGRWDAPRGRAILDATLIRLKRRGVRRVVIVGLSAGGIGLSRLAPRLRLPEGMSLEGLVQLSGTAAPAHPRRVPTLILQGGRDRMTPPAPARRHARALGGRARYVEVSEAGHWLLLSHHERVHDELSRFFARQLSADDAR